MTAQKKYITSLLSIFSTFLESHSVSNDLALFTTEKFIEFINTKKNNDKDWSDNWSTFTIDQFLTAQNIPHKSAVLMRKFVNQYPPLEIDVFLHEFLSSLKKNKRSNSTIKNYRSDIQHFSNFVKSKRIKQLFKPENLRTFVHDQIKTGLKLSTVKRKLSSISQFALWAESEKIVTDASFWISDIESLITGKNSINYKQNPIVKAGITKSSQKELEDFLLSLEIDKHSQATVKNYKSDISQFLDFSKESNITKVITQDQLTNFVIAQKKLGLKLNSIKRKVSSISKFALWAESRNSLFEVSYWIHQLQTQLPEIIEPTSLNNKLIHAHQKNNKTPKVGWKLPVPSFAVSNSNKDDQQDETNKENQNVYSGIRSSLKEFANQINIKRNKQFLPYLNLVMLVVFVIGLGVLSYQQFITQAPTPFAFPSTPTRPNRELSFQGRLTDTAQNPIITSTDMAFRLYDNLTVGTQLWDSGTCSVTPDQDGIFNVGLGDSCGAEISADVFSENSNVWLEVEIASETLSPRQSIKTVAYALNSETVQGYPISATGAATTNTILTMDSGGQILLGEVSPTLKATTGTFSIEAQALSIETSSGSNGDISLTPDGLGKVIVQSDLDLTGYLHAPGATLSATYAGGTALVARGGPSGTGNIQEWQNSSGTALSVVDASGNVGVGTTGPQNILHINTDFADSVSTGLTNKGIVFSDSSNGVVQSGIFPSVNSRDIDFRSGDSFRFFGNPSTQDGAEWRAYNSGNTYFSGLYNNGTLAIIRSYKDGGGTALPISFQISGSEQMRLDQNGNLGIGSTSPGYTLDVVGELNLTGAIRVAGDAGTSGYILTSAAGAANTWTDPSTLGASLWVNTLNVLHPKNEYANIADLALGGTSTASANVHLQSNGEAYFAGNVGIGTTAPNEQLEIATAAGARGIFSDGAGSNRKALLFEGPGTTHPGYGRIDAYDYGASAALNLSLAGSGGNVGIGTTAPLGLLDVRGAAKGQALLQLQELGDQDILVASNSAGTTRFRMANTGYMYAERFSDISNNTYYLDPAGATTSMAVASNVGIGTDTPGARLDVRSNVTSGENIMAQFLTDGVFDDVSGKIGIRMGRSYDSPDRQIEFGYGSASAFGQSPYFYISTGDDAGSISEALRVDYQGNVGIGTTTPSTKLAVVGDDNTSVISQDTGSGYMEMSQDSWSSSFGTLYNGYRANPGVDGHLYTTGNTKYKRDAGSNSRSAASIGGYLNGASGHIWLHSAPSGAVDGNIVWTRLADFSQEEIWLSPTGDSSDLYIASDGNIGIGATSPSDKLDIFAPNSQLRLTDTDDGSFAQFSQSGGNFAIRQNSTSAVHFFLNSSGNVGIGAVTASAKLDIVPTTGAALELGRVAGQPSIKSSETFLILDSNGSETSLNHYVADDVWLVNGGGNVGIGTTAPSAELDVNGIIQGGFGAITTGGTTDWDHITNSKSGNGYSLLQGTSTNGPSAAGGNYFHPLNFEYSSKNGTGNTTQFAFPYGNDASINQGIYMRGRYLGAWGNWAKIISENVSGNVGIGNTSAGEKLDVTGVIRSSSNIQSGFGSGGVALTINDGYGNANVTFNHMNGIAEQTGNAGRIEVNTDGTSDATMYFELGDNLTSGVGTGLSSILTLKSSGYVGVGITPTQALHVSGNSLITGNTYIGNVDTYFYRYSADMIATPDSFYVQSGSLATYLYSNNTYLGATSGDIIHTRGNIVNIGTDESGQDANLRINNYTSNAVSDGIQFYEGSTRVGEIGVEDTSWLRINQETNTNIYTPRYIRADNGFRIDSDNFSVNADATRLLLTSQVWGSSTTGLVLVQGGDTGNNPVFQVANGLNTHQHIEFHVEGDGSTWNRGGHDFAENILTNDQTTQNADIVVIDKERGNNLITSGHGNEEDFDENEYIKTVWVKKTSKAYDNSVVGIISTSPGSLLASFLEEEDFPGQIRPLALTGRVPLKVSTKNGNLKRGDAITTSVLPGIGMKSTQAGQIVGKVMEPFIPSELTCTDVSDLESIMWPEDHGSNPTSTCFKLPDGTYIGKIMVFANTTWFDPTVDLNGQGLVSINGDTNLGFNTTNDGIEVTSVASLAQAFIANIQAGLTSTKDLIVENTATIANLSVDSLTINGQTLADYIQSVTSGQVASNGTALISPVANDTAINIETASGSVLFRDESDNTIAQISNQGSLSLLGELVAKDIVTNSITASGSSTLGSLIANQATISGSLTVAQDATVAGTLVANKIEAVSSRIALLEAGIAQLEHAKVTTAEITTATISGTLYANNIHANNIYDFEETIASTLQQPSLLDIITGINQNTTSQTQMNDLYDTINKSEFNATRSADLNLTLAELSTTNDDVTITGTALFVEKYLKVNGAGYVSDSLAVGNSLLIGSSTQIADGLINYTTNDPSNQILKIQPNGNGSIELLAGIVTIDDSGKVTVNGDLEVTGNARIAGTLLTDQLKPTNFGNPLQVQVAGIDTQTNEVKKSRFEIINEVGTPVATFSAEGNAEFAGRVNVKGDIGVEGNIDIGGELRLDSQDLGSSDNNELTASKTSGKATIKSGANEVTIKSSIINNDTLIYVTAVGSTDNQVIYVKNQTAQDPDNSQEGSFVVGFDSNTSSDVSFNWWIVN